MYSFLIKEINIETEYKTLECVFNKYQLSSFSIYLLLIILAIICFLLFMCLILPITKFDLYFTKKFFSQNTITVKKIKEIKTCNYEFLPIYIGYFVIALSTPHIISFILPNSRL